MASPINVSVWIVLMLALIAITFIIWGITTETNQKNPEAVVNASNIVKGLVEFQGADISIQCSKFQDKYLYNVKIKGKAFYKDQTELTSSIDFRNEKAGNGDVYNSLSKDGVAYESVYTLESKKPFPLDKRQTIFYQGPLKPNQDLYLGKFFIQYENQVQLKVPYLGTTITSCRNYFKISCPNEIRSVSFSECEDKDCSTNINICGFSAHIEMKYNDRNDCGSRELLLIARVGDLKTTEKVGEILSLSFWKRTDDIIQTACWQKSISELDNICLDAYKGPSESNYIITPANYDYPRSAC